MIIKTTATTPPIMVEVSVSVLELSAWKTSVAGTNKKRLTMEENSHLPPVETRMGVLSVVPATLVADTVRM